MPGGGGDENDRALQHDERLPSTLRDRVSVILSKLGAVSVTPRNMLALLRAGESVLLYPGGAKEALHQKVTILDQLRLLSVHISPAR